MKIHKEGYKSIVIVFAINIVLFCLSFFLFRNLPLQYHISVVCFLVLFLFFIVRFFRVPKRVINKAENGALSPADGTIVSIVNRFENEYLKEDRIQVSIFMSVFNVHVNSYPIDGDIVYTKHHLGKYFAAHLPKSSTDNEHTTIVIKSKNGVEILFRQIAGLIARRIVFYAKTGEKAIQGEEMGIIKFGSRVDVFLPLNATVLVKVGDKVISKKTVLAHLH